MVKFIVKVRLMEKSVNSHVGRVIVAKVINQKRRPGMMLRRKRTALPKAANTEEIP